MSVGEINVFSFIIDCQLCQAINFHTGGPQFESQPGSCALGQGTLSSLPSPSERT